MPDNSGYDIYFSGNANNSLDPETERRWKELEELESRQDGCYHWWEWYVGFTEQYWYCSKCSKKDFTRAPKTI